MNLRKIRLYLAALLVPLLLFSGCHIGRVENNLVYDLDASPVNLDPQSAADPASQLVISCIFEALVRLDSKGEPLPAAAESWKVEDGGLRYVFTLREDGCWSNGDPVTAEDFVFGFRRLLLPETNAPEAEKFFCLENARAVHNGSAGSRSLGVRALDGDTLEFRLERPEPRFFEYLSYAAAMPCHQGFFEEARGKYGLAGNKIRGNGAFVLSSWSQGGNLSLRPSSRYWNRENVTATSLLLVTPKEERGARLERFQDGTLSAASFSGQNFQALGDTSRLTVTENDNAVWGMIFNLDREPFSADAMRKALFLDADFSTMAERLPPSLTLVRHILSSAQLIDGQNYRDFAGEPDFPQPDPPAAAAACQEALAAGISSDSLRSARLILPEGEGHETFFAYLSQIWQRDLGLYLTVEVLPAADYQSRLASGDYECALYRLSGDAGGPGAVLGLMGGSPGLADTAYNALLEEAESLSGRAAARKYLEAEQLLLDRYLFLPFYQQAEYFVQNAGVSGITYDFYTQLPDFRFGRVE